MSKDSNYAHILVTSSDGFAFEILKEHLDPPYTQLIELEDLTHEEVKLF